MRTFCTDDGYRFYAHPNGRVSDTKKCPRGGVSRCEDMSWPSVASFRASMKRQGLKITSCKLPKRRRR
jgi:hypothetical protein